MADTKSKVAMSDKTEISTTLESKSNDNNKNMTFIGKKKKPLVTKSADEEEEKKSSQNTRGIPRAVYLENPYDIIYKNQQERYLREVEDVLGYDYDYDYDYDYKLIISYHYKH